MAQVPEQATRDPADGEAKPPKPLADIAWRAGRRRRLAALAVSSSAGTIAIVVAVVLLPLAGRTTPDSALKVHVPAPPIALRTALQFRQIAVIEGPAPCPQGSSEYVFGEGGCFQVARPGMTVTKVKSAQIIHGPASYAIAIRLVPRQVGELAALTRFVARQPAPRDRLAVLVGGTVVSDPVVESPLLHGDVLIVVRNHAQAEQILRELVGAR